MQVPEGVGGVKEEEEEEREGKEGGGRGEPYRVRHHFTAPNTDKNWTDSVISHSAEERWEWLCNPSLGWGIVQT